jgi:DNA-binding CsgD family transcriptional regulator/GAF domain-containing protein
MGGTQVARLGSGLPGAVLDEVRALLARTARLADAEVMPDERRPLDQAGAQGALLAAWDATRAALTATFGDPDRAARATELLDLLGELRRVSDQLRDEHYREREGAFERVRGALALLRDVESTNELVDQAVVAICQLGFDRAIVSRVDNELWVAQSVYIGRDAKWAEEILQVSRSNPQLVHPGLVEAEVVRTGRSVLVEDVEARPNVNRPIADASLSRAYVAAPIIAHGAVVGFLHADCYYQGRDLSEADRAALALFGEGFGYALARTAVLDRLETLRADLSQLRAGLTSKAGGVWSAGEHRPQQVTPRRLPQPPDIAGTGLTRREIDVLQWMARGETNGRIARRLNITEGTVKTHVQAILRKLGAANRAEAVSMWVQVSRLGREG